MSDTTSANAAQSAPSALANRRRRLLTWLVVAVALAAAVYGVWWLIFSGKTVKTDDAYVGADVAQVTPLVAGPVAKVLVRETQAVTAGTPLVILDASDTKILVEQAKAALGQAERKVRGYAANDTAFAGQLSARDADIARAQSDLERARTDLTRRQALSAGPAGSAAPGPSRTAFTRSRTRGASAGDRLRM